MKSATSQFYLVVLGIFLSWNIQAQCPQNAEDLANGFTIPCNANCTVDVAGGIEITGKVTVEKGGTLNIVYGSVDISGGSLVVNGNFNIDADVVMWIYNGGKVNIGTSGVLNMGGDNIEVYKNSSLNVSGKIDNVNKVWNLIDSRINISKTGVVNAVDFHNFQGTSTINGIVSTSGIFRTHEGILKGEGFIEGKFVNNNWRALDGAFAGCETGDVQCGNPVASVDYKRLKAVASKDSVKLEWKTLKERDIKGFYIEKSQDRYNFLKIGFVNTDGWTDETKSYSFTDKNSESKTYYRISYQNSNGQVFESTVLTVDGTQPKEQVIISAKKEAKRAKRAYQALEKHAK